MLRAAREAVNEFTSSPDFRWDGDFRRARMNVPRSTSPAPMAFFRLPAFAGTGRHSRESMSSRKRVRVVQRESGVVPSPSTTD